MRKGVFQRKSESRLARAVKYAPHVIRTIFFVRCIAKISRVSVVLYAESWFSRTSTVKFEVCFNFPHTWNSTALVRENQLSARKTIRISLTFGVRLTTNYFCHFVLKIKTNIHHSCRKFVMAPVGTRRNFSLQYMLYLIRITL